MRRMVVRAGPVGRSPTTWVASTSLVTLKYCQRLDRALAHLSRRRLDEDDRPDSWVLDGVNLVYRSLKVFVQELGALGSNVGVGLRSALDANEHSYPLRPPE